MTTVILNQPNVPGVVIPAPEAGDTVIKNTFFFPDVDPKRVRELMRLGQTVSDARLRNAIKTGMAEINAELYDYRARQIAAGLRQLADVPAEEIDGESEHVFHYLSAATALATANLYEHYRGVRANGKGDKKARSVETTIDDLWRDMRWFVSRLQDKPRCFRGQR